MITRTFSKELRTFDSSMHVEIVSLISKYARGLSKNLLLLKKEGDLIILKGYLDGKRVRVTIAQTAKGNYIPLEILKKESKDGYNIRSNYDPSGAIDKMNQDIMEDAYEIWEGEA